jgi:hypothetical protein
MPDESLKLRPEPSKKEWLKFIHKIDDSYLCEALIIELEAQKAKLNADFKSKTP